MGHALSTKHMSIGLLLLALPAAQFGVTWLYCGAQRALGKNSAAGHAQACTPTAQRLGTWREAILNAIRQFILWILKKFISLSSLFTEFATCFPPYSPRPRSSSHGLS